tara:strand:- start:5766 stop:6302 length:537 start_codon:yes stop_codon:yes gene_type:complete
MNINFGIYKPQQCAETEQQKSIYRKVIGKAATWYYAINKENSADFIYASTRNKEGFGGRELQFELEDGTVDIVIGPWQGAASSMKQETGVDITNKHLMSFVVCEKYKYAEGHYQNGECINVLHGAFNECMDFDDPRNIARKIAMEREDLDSVYLVQVSSGGGMAGYEKLDGKLRFKVE